MYLPGSSWKKCTKRTKRTYRPPGVHEHFTLRIRSPTHLFAPAFWRLFTFFVLILCGLRGLVFRIRVVFVVVIACVRFQCYRDKYLFVFLPLFTFFVPILYGLRLFEDWFLEYEWFLSWLLHVLDFSATEISIYLLFATVYLFCTNFIWSLRIVFFRIRVVYRAVLSAFFAQIFCSLMS